MSTIRSTLIEANANMNEYWINNTLFLCKKNADGAIAYFSACTNGCIDGGSGKSDYCA